MFGIQEENVPGGHTRAISNSEGASEVTEHSRGNPVQRKHKNPELLNTL
jgi:hypothetical protein